MNELHIVSFDVPFPADYGGVIDVFYNIKYLAAMGVQIYLHCFEYGRGEQPELNKYCKEVWYYPRKKGLTGISFRLPYIVSSRKNDVLLRRLCEIDAPILFEGVHTTYYLNHPQLSKRFKAIRIHNIEADYYGQLSGKETNIIKKIYFKLESFFLEKYEKKLKEANAFFALSIDDSIYFRDRYPNSIHEYIAPFHPYNEVLSATGCGKFCLYHGNLSHPENKEIVFFLLNSVIPFLNCKFIIAGKNPDKQLVETSCNAKNCEIFENPSDSEMKKMISEAHIQVLPTFQRSGVKLKLMAALFGGRHIIVNNAMLHGTCLEPEENLSSSIWVAEDAKKITEAINTLMLVPFAEKDKHLRQNIVEPFNNQKNAIKLWERISQKEIDLS